MFYRVSTNDTYKGNNNDGRYLFTTLEMVMFFDAKDYTSIDTVLERITERANSWITSITRPINTSETHDDQKRFVRLRICTFDPIHETYSPPPMDINACNMSKALRLMLKETWLYHKRRNFTLSLSEGMNNTVVYTENCLNGDPIHFETFMKYIFTNGGIGILVDVIPQASGKDEFLEIRNRYRQRIFPISNDYFLKKRDELFKKLCDDPELEYVADKSEDIWVYSKIADKK